MDDKQIPVVQEFKDPTLYLCKKCGVEKSMDDFYPDLTKVHGIRSSCKACQRAFNSSVEELARKQARKKVSRVKDPRKFLLAAARNRAKAEGVAFNIGLNNVFIPEHCPVFGTKFVIGDGHRHPASPTLDRINPRLGYIVGNVAVISWKANSIKRDATLEELEKLLAFMKSYDRVDQFISDTRSTVVKVSLRHNKAGVC